MYGKTKLFVEEMLADLFGYGDIANLAALRYFNPVGAHPSGEIGEDPNAIPDNLVPFVCQVALGKLEKLRVFGIYNVWRVDILRLKEIADKFKKEYNLKSSWAQYDPERY